MKGKFIKVVLSGLMIIFTLTVSITATETGFYGYVQNYSVIKSENPGDIFLLRNRFRLNTELQSDMAHAWASLDVNSESQDGGLHEISLREAYLDLFFPKLDLRIGKQQVVWGKADGLFINDLVNPLDLRMFILQDFEDIRMGIDMLKADIWAGNYSLELVAIPKFVPMKMAPKGSPWAFPQPEHLSLGIPTSFVLKTDTPSGPMYTPVFLDSFGYTGILPIQYSHRDYSENLKNSEFGWKLNGFTLGFDWSLLYLKVRDDQPVFFKSVDSTMALPIDGIELPMSLIFQERHPWLNIIGANFSTSVGSFVFRGEGGFFKDKHFDYLPEITVNDTVTLTEITQMMATFNMIESSGLLKKKDYLQYMLGFDYSLTSSIDLSMQFIQQHIFDYEPSIIADEDVYISTLLLRGRYVNDTLLPVFLMMYNFTSESSLIRFWLDWNAADAFTITVGTDVFDGKKDDFFGSFRDNDNFYFKLKYSF